MRKTGRPSERTPAVEREVLNILRSGCFRIDAARAVGVTRQTFWRWVREDVTFRTAVETAEAEAVVVLVEAAAKRNPLEILSRRYRRWRARDPKVSSTATSSPTRAKRDPDQLVGELFATPQEALAWIDRFRPLVERAITSQETH